MGRRTILLIAALAVAALGTVLVWLYAKNADDRAQAGAEQREVLVATAGIPTGSSGSAISESASVELQRLPASAIPEGALSDLTPVSDLVTISTVFTGQVLLEQMFGTQQEASGGLTLPEGTMGVSVSLGDPERVAGFVSPGSEVAIFVTAIGVGDVEDQQTALLLDRVPVVAVGPSTVSSKTTTTEGEQGQTTNTEAIPTAILTLALNQDQSQKVIQATTAGSLYFALLNDKSEVDPRVPGTTTDILLD